MIVNLKIPESNYPPAQPSQGYIYVLVSPNVRFDFLSPEFRIAFEAMYFCCHVPITMPKRAVAENGDLVLNENEVGRSNQLPIIFSIAKTSGP
jgi:hypothetical protein